MFFVVFSGMKICPPEIHECNLHVWSRFLSTIVLEKMCKYEPILKMEAFKGWLLNEIN